jgi:hypothetical protein
MLASSKSRSKNKPILAPPPIFTSTPPHVDIDGC